MWSSLLVTTLECSSIFAGIFKPFGKQRIWFKIMLLTFKCLKGKAPVFLRYMVERYMPGRNLRSSSALLLKVPRLKNKTLGARTFAYAAASIWSSLPREIRFIDNIYSFKSS